MDASSLSSTINTNQTNNELINDYNKQQQQQQVQPLIDPTQQQSLQQQQQQFIHNSYMLPNLVNGGGIPMSPYPNQMYIPPPLPPLPPPSSNYNYNDIQQNYMMYNNYNNYDKSLNANANIKQQFNAPSSITPTPTTTTTSLQVAPTLNTLLKQPVPQQQQQQQQQQQKINNKPTKNQSKKKTKLNNKINSNNVVNSDIGSDSSDSRLSTQSPIDCLNSQSSQIINGISTPPPPPSTSSQSSTNESKDGISDDSKYANKYETVINEDTTKNNEIKEKEHQQQTNNKSQYDLTAPLLNNHQQLTSQNVNGINPTSSSTSSSSSPSATNYCGIINKMNYESQNSPYNNQMLPPPSPSLLHKHNSLNTNIASPSAIATTLNSPQSMISSLNSNNTNNSSFQHQQSSSSSSPSQSPTPSLLQQQNLFNQNNPYSNFQNRNMVSTQQQQYTNENYIKKLSNNEPTTPQSTSQQHEFTRPPSSNTPLQQQLSNDTPNSTPRSPGACSNSSFHEDDTTMSSPNSSMQASSPKQHHLTNPSLNNSSSLLNTSNHTSSNNTNNTDIFQKLLDMGNENERKTFVDRIQTVWEEFNIQCRNLPNISKHPLDLYKLYSSVRDKGGFNEVTKLKLWKEISAILNIANSASAAFNVKKKYVQLGVFHYECKYDRGGIDPIPLVNDMEKSNKKAPKAEKPEKPSKKSKNSSSSNLNSNGNTNGTNNSNNTNTNPNSNNNSNNTNNVNNNTSNSNPTNMTNHVQYPMENNYNHTNFHQNTNHPGALQQNPMQSYQQQQTMMNQYPNQQNQNYYNPQQQQQQHLYPGAIGQPNQQQLMQNKQMGMSYPYMNSQQQQQQQQQTHPYMQQNLPQSQIPPQNMYQQMQRPPMPTQTSQSQQPQQYPDANLYNSPQYQMQARYMGMPNSIPPQTPGPTSMPQQTPNTPVSSNQHSVPHTIQQPMQGPVYSQSSLPNSQTNANNNTNQLNYAAHMQQQQQQQPQSQIHLQHHPQQSQHMIPQQNTSDSAETRLMPPQPPQIPYQTNNSQIQAQLQQPVLNNNQQPPHPTVAQQFQRPPSTDSLSKMANNSIQPPIQQPTQPSTISHLQQHLRPQPTPTPPQLNNTSANSYIPPTTPTSNRYSKMPQQIPPATAPSSTPYLITQQNNYMMAQNYHPLHHQQIQQQQQHQLQLQLQQQQQQQLRKEPLFPPDSIEATQPIEVKKRKITSKDITPCDPWKLFMCLKSGLLSESTWALDALNVLLFDDNTIPYFHLKHFPGLIKILLEHYLKCLQLIFENEFDHINLNINDDDNLDDELIINFNENGGTINSINNKNNKLKNNGLVNDDDEDDDDDSDDDILDDYENVKEDENDDVDNDDDELNINNKIKNIKEINKNGKVFKLLFNDKEINRFYNQHKKINRLNDSRSTLQLNNYHYKIINKYLNKNKNKNVKKLKTSDNLKLKRNYIRTHFSTNDELDNNERLFFGNKIYNEKLKSKENRGDEILENKKASTTSTTTSNLEINRKNDEFIERHKRKLEDNYNDYEEQAKIEEESLFKIMSQKEEELIQRCMCISTIFRNLSFIPGNDIELCKNISFITIIANLLKFKHVHNYKNSNHSNIKDNNDNDSISCDYECNEWWWEGVNIIRENTLVTISNIASALNLNNYNEYIIKLIIDGLIHWSICKSSDTIDTLITLPDTSTISAQKLSIESISKMTIFDVNIDLILATINNYELECLLNILSEFLNKRDEQTLREFSIVILTSMAKCDQLSTKLITKYCSLLISFIEDFEEQSRIIYSQQNHHSHSHHHHHHHSHHHHHHGGSNHNQYQFYNTNGNDFNNYFNEDNLGTTADMLRRCANCLVYLSLVPDNITTIIKYEERLLDLTTSQYVDLVVGQKLAQVLYNCTNSNNNNNRLFLPYT